MKRHGFDPPLHPFQVCAWVALIVLSTGFYLLHMPVMNHLLQILIGVLFTSLLLITLVLGLLCTITDCSDPTVKEERTAVSMMQRFDSDKYSKQCPICETHVLEKTKHCMQCNRCVLGFDHHCKWLNNCIGELNYGYFIGLISSLELMMCVLIATGVTSAVIAFHDEEAKDYLRSLFNTEHLLWYYVLSCFVTSLAVAVFLFNGNLIVFHIYIKSKGQTTFEYIVAQRKRKGQISDTSHRDYRLAHQDSRLPEEVCIGVALSRLPNLNSSSIAVDEMSRSNS